LILAISAVLLVCSLILVVVLLAISPGKPQPFLDGTGQPLAGGISEKIQVNINGVEQGMFIKGKDKTRPVLLFPHGGPGMPEYAVSRKYQPVLEHDFVVCWWEQGGSELSYHPEIPLLELDSMPPEYRALRDEAMHKIGIGTTNLADIK
jgi:hypothetical protein